MSKGLQVKRSTSQKVPKSKGLLVKRSPSQKVPSQKVPSQKVYKNVMLEIKAYMACSMIFSAKMFQKRKNFITYTGLSL